MRQLRTFYTLIITQIFSLIGSRMTGIAIGIFVFQETGNTSPLLIAAFFMEIPGMVMGSFTGIIADRLDRRYVIMIGDAGQAVGMLLLMLSFLSGAFQLWHLYAVMLMQGIFGMLQAPASQAAITMLVPESHRDRANSIREIGFPLAGVIAPMVAGILFGIAGVVGVMLVDLVTFVVAMIVVYLIHIPHPQKSEEGTKAEASIWKQIVGGWSFLMKRRALLAMTIFISFIYFLINGPLELAIPYISTLTSDETILGLLLGVGNLGAFSGALSLAVIGKVTHRIRIIMFSFIWLGLMFLIYGIVRHPILLAVTVFFLYFPLPLAGALFATILQTKTPSDLQGRVFAITGQMAMLATPFSFLITGALVDNTLEPAVGTPGWERVAPLVGSEAGAGMGLLMVIIGGIILVTTILVYLSPTIRNLETALPDYELPSDLSNSEENNA